MKCINNHLVRKLNIKPDFKELETEMLNVIITSFIETHSDRKVTDIESFKKSYFEKKLSKSAINSILGALNWKYESPPIFETYFQDYVAMLYFYFNTYVFSWERMYFFNEFSFSSGDLERSKQVYIKDGAGKSERYNGFFIVGLDGCSYKLRNESQTTKELILEYLEEVLKCGYLKEDSILYLGSVIRDEPGMIEHVEALYKKYNFLEVRPQYLPDFAFNRNPVQRFFTYIKDNLYLNKKNKPFLDEIIETINDSLIINQNKLAELYCETLAFWVNNQ
ncbi:hypothetical protein ACTA71_011019 [Dictyostelium dimigraforme]